MDVISRAKALGATSALALVGPDLFRDFLLAAQRIEGSDLKSLNAAIALERAGIKAYTDGAGTGLLSTPVLNLCQGFVKDHTAHRDALLAAVKQSGATPTEDTTALTYPALKSQDDILTFAYSVERQAASTYLSLIPTLKNQAFAQLMASILGVETTHVALLAQSLRRTPAYPSGFVSS